MTDNDREGSRLTANGRRQRDLFGLGWRHELAAEILANLDQIDVVEVMIEDYLDRDGAGARAIQTLSSNVPVVLHGVSLGLASTVPVDRNRLEAVGAFVGAVRPAYWSEHLAYVRAGDIEVGHLLPPTRTIATARATIRNIREATAIVGSAPLVENVATLMAPPGSDLDEPQWITDVLTGASCGLLLDLHNVYTNSVNCGGDPFEFVARLPPELIQAIHVAGGQLIDEPHGADTPPRQRVLDDHTHPIPAIVYELLTEVGRIVEQPLTVLLEYDGTYPPFAELMTQIDRAREALSAGRRRSALDGKRSAVSGQRSTADGTRPLVGGPSSPAFEAFIVSVMLDPGRREQFLTDPKSVALAAGLTLREATALESIDRIGLLMAARSLAKKRSRHAG